MKVIKLKLFKVNACFAVSIGLILENDPSTVKRFNIPLLEKRDFKGSTTYYVSPSPFLIINIGSRVDEQEGMPENVRSCTINRKDLYFMVRSLTNFYAAFKKEEAMFFYDANKHLQVNQSLAPKYNFHIPCGQKVVHVGPSVITVDNGSEYEGCYFAINSLDNHVLLTYSELGYLIYELSHTNMEALSLQLIQTALLLEQH